MPKTFNEHERVVIREDMLKVGSSILRKKGIRNISVEDITKGVKISKGSYYTFFNSKEELIWEVIKHEEQLMLEQIMTVASQDLDTKTKLCKIFTEIYLRDESLVYYLPQEDIEYFSRKISPKILKADFENAYNIHRTILTACNLEPSPENIDVSLSMQNLMRIVANSDIPRSESTRAKVLNVLVESFVKFFCESEKG